MGSLEIDSCNIFELKKNNRSTLIFLEIDCLIVVSYNDSWNFICTSVLLCYFSYMNILLSNLRNTNDEYVKFFFSDVFWILLLKYT